VYAAGTVPDIIPQQFARMTRSPDGTFILVAATTGSQVTPSAWQMLRVVPGAPTAVDVLTIDTPSGCSANPVEDIAFATTASSPFTACILAADDCTYKASFFDIGATGSPSTLIDGANVPSGFGGDMTPDLSHNRIFV